ncbi:hypothetical protein LOD99_12854 [Oopsacas minuta]|uniref:PH domain-containing protein n=1 Tax=Oopsacas minuta TaxID=111878 RepID=A0AAV7JDI3_9METZ|nr:hypothetical protein LOD99_12854 [Oopsacas minuta]
MSHKKKRLHISSKNRWKRHWCSVRGASLILHSKEDSSVLYNARADPILCLDLEGSLVQTAYECFKRNHVFTISLPNGHAYYMQAITQGELLKWIQQLHCSAAIACTRQLNRSLAIDKLRMRCTQLETEIEGDLKIKNRADNKLSSTQDVSLKEKLSNELTPLEFSVDLLQAELYRYRFTN